MLRLLRFGTVAAAVAGALVAASAFAQFSPPSTVFGSVTDEAGPVAAGLPVEAYIADLLCGKGVTEYVGDGSARVTVYAVNVSSREDKAGCGTDGSTVRVKVGDRFGAQTARWKAGPVQLDVTFGNVAPAAIPTFTPAPTRTPTPPAQPSETAQAGSATAVGTIPKGSPGAGSPVPTLRGGVISATPGPSNAGSADSGGGFPLWAVAVIVLAAIAVAGGGVGLAMARNRGAESDDPFAPGPPID